MCSKCPSRIWSTSGVIFNDLERPLSPISRSRHYLMLNISESVQDTDTVSMES